MTSDVPQCTCPVFLSLFLEKTVLSSSLVPGLMFMNWPRTCGFTPGLSKPSLSPRVCVRARSSLWGFLPLRDVVWSRRGRCLQLCSFSESFWLFEVLFNISSLTLGLFLFLWKMARNILWSQSVYLLMALVGMDIWIPHCSSAWVWNSFLFLCVFFGFFSSVFKFSDYWCFMYLIKFVARCFNLFDAIISGIFLIFVSGCY